MSTNARQTLENLVSTCEDDKALYKFISIFLENDSIRDFCNYNTSLKEKVITNIIENSPDSLEIRRKRSILSYFKTPLNLLTYTLAMNGDKSLVNIINKYERETNMKFHLAFDNAKNKNLKALIKENLPLIDEAQEKIEGIKESFDQ
jgi:hypothetical protein